MAGAIRRLERLHLTSLARVRGDELEVEEDVERRRAEAVLRRRDVEQAAQRRSASASSSAAPWSQGAP